MAKKKYDVKNLMVSGNTISILGIIGDSWWEESNTSSQFLREFKALEKRFDSIIVEINSPGGSVMEGLPIYNAISNSEKEIITRNIGIAASMGAIILVAGDKVETFANALTMLHSPSTVVYGNSKELREEADVVDTFENSLITSISKKTGKTIEETKALYFNFEDHWFNADQAKDALLIDTIIDDEADLPKDALNMKMSDIMNYYSDKYGQPTAQNSPIKNFFTNLTNTDSKMKIDAQLISALNLDAKATIEQAVKAIQDMVTNRDDAQSNLTAEQDAHKLVKDKVVSLEADLASSKTSVTDITSERDTLQGQVTKVTDILDTISPAIKDAEDFDKKLDAFTSFTDEEETKQFLARDKGNSGAPQSQWDKDATDFLED